MEIIIEILKSMAKERKVISYHELLQDLNLLSSQKMSHKELINMLRTVGDYCNENKIPPLNCLVVSEFNLPGKGFYVWCGVWAETYIDTNDLNMRKTIFNIFKTQCFRAFNDYKNEKE